MSRFVAVIDLGKTNSKVALVDTQTATELTVDKQLTTTRSDTLYPSLDHQTIQTFIFSALRALSNRHRIDAITVTTHGATTALLDKAGELALPVLDYEFSGIDDTRLEYDRFRPPFSETGSPALPGGLNIGAQLFWQQTYFPEIFSSVDTLLTWPQYWVYILTGNRLNDVTSLGCHTDLYEPARKTYSKYIDRMRWRKLMAPTTLSGQLAGFIRQDIAVTIGMNPDTPVYTGIHDSNASLVPHLLSNEGAYSVVSTGTWFVVMAIEGTPTTLIESRDMLLNINAHGQSVPSARYMGGRERELLNTEKLTSEEALDRLLSNHHDPAMLMPSIVSGTGPYPDDIKQWLGEDTSNDKPLYDCAVTLYLALMTHECMKSIGCEGPTYIEGPLAHDKHFAQMLMAASKRPVSLSMSETGTSVGAAMLISKPEQPPDYQQLTIPEERKIELERYASSWQQKRQHHSR